MTDQQTDRQGVSRSRIGGGDGGDGDDEDGDDEEMKMVMMETMAGGSVMVVIILSIMTNMTPGGFCIQTAIPQQQSTY